MSWNITTDAGYLSNKSTVLREMLK